MGRYVWVEDAPSLSASSIVPTLPYGRSRSFDSDCSADNLARRAVEEMRACKIIFDGLSERLEEKTGHASDPSILQITYCVDRLRCYAGAGLAESESLVECHREIASIMAQYANGLSRRSHETVRSLCDEIAQRSANLSEHVYRMQEDVQYMVGMVYQVQKETEKKRGLWTRIRKWLARFFSVLAGLLSIGAAVAVFSPPPFSAAATGLSLGSTLVSLLARICRGNRAHRLGEVEFERLLSFLYDVVPMEIEKARQLLTNFQQCHESLQREIRVQCEAQRRYPKDRTIATYSV